MSFCFLSLMISGHVSLSSISSIKWTYNYYGNKAVSYKKPAMPAYNQVRCLYPICIGNVPTDETAAIILYG